MCHSKIQIRHRVYFFVVDLCMRGKIVSSILSLSLSFFSANLALVGREVSRGKKEFPESFDHLIFAHPGKKARKKSILALFSLDRNIFVLYPSSAVAAAEPPPPLPPELALDGAHNEEKAIV